MIKSSRKGNFLIKFSTSLLFISLLPSRFRKADIPELAAALGIPQEMHATQGTKWEGLEGLCILLRRLNYPKRLDDLVAEFGRHQTELSIICNEMVYYVHKTWNHLLDSFNQNWLCLESLRAFAEAIFEKDCPLDNCFGFIDGVLKPCARPIYNQRSIYNGKDRTHGLKYQSVMMPNGLIGNLYGPVEGSKHDSSMLRESGVLDQISHFTLADGRPLVLYGDKAYPIYANLITPYRGVALTPEEKRFNLLMNAERISVEWGFGKVATNFAFTNYAPNLKLYLQPIALYYRVAAILTNCHTCLYGSQTGSYFGLNPPELAEYLQPLQQ